MDYIRPVWRGSPDHLHRISRNRSEVVEPNSMITHRQSNEKSLGLARVFQIPHTVIGFANNGSFQPIQTYYWSENNEK